MEKEFLLQLTILAGIIIAMLFILTIFLIREVQKRKDLEERLNDLDSHMVGFLIELKRQAELRII